ncbi:MAG: hypothetical protein IT270_13760 [Saprospiraceae bacterium]|nr:hypothetical protein [Saprospiraceae bacterium]
MPKVLVLTIFAAMACNTCSPPQRPSLPNPGVPDRTTCQTPGGNPNTMDKNQMFIRRDMDKSQLKSTTEWLVISVKTVNNPGLEPMTFEVSLELPSETLTVGTFSLFPPNEPGVFTFRVNNQVQKIQDAQNVCLIVKHMPEADAAVSDKVSVTFDEARWQ